MWQVICLENSGEVCSHEARLDDFTNLIDIDVVKVSDYQFYRAFGFHLSF